MLVFSHISERDGAAILRTIAKTLQENYVSVDYLIITTYEERLDGTQDLGGLSCFIRAQNTFTDCTLERCMNHNNRSFADEIQQHYIQAWREYQPDAEVSVELTVEGALSLARAADRGAGMHTLITGSLYLVGSALRLLEPA